MTKDWDAVQDEIKELSFNQKKPLEEVKELMERKYKFRASTRAYRMKLKEWGFMRHKGRKQGSEQSRIITSGTEEDENEPRVPSEPAEPMALDSEPLGHQTERGGWQVVSTNERTDAQPTFMGLLSQPPNFQPTVDTPECIQDPPAALKAVHEMLACILDKQCERLETLLMEHVDEVNNPIGLPFELRDSHFANHPALSEMVIMQHPQQTLLDIASAMPDGPIVWLLLSYGAKGSTHPSGIDLSLYNAIRNGRHLTVQAFLIPGRFDVHGSPDKGWCPLLQAIFWTGPEVVSILLKRGARVDDYGPSPISPGVHTALQLCLKRRSTNYGNESIRSKCNENLKLLLNAGANIHVSPPEGSIASAFEMFLEPWQSKDHWNMKLSWTEMVCLGLFVRNGADLSIQFVGSPCAAGSCNTFVHQIIWHSPPCISRQVVHEYHQEAPVSGALMLHEVIGHCPDANRHCEDVLGDLKILLSRGVDPNALDSLGITPLRKCIEQVSSIDVLAVAQRLLDYGADPEFKDVDGVQPYAVAALALAEPTRLRVLQAMLAKMEGHSSICTDGRTYKWEAGLFPIPEDPTYQQVHACTEPHNDFQLSMNEMVAFDVQPAFRRAYLANISDRFLANVTKRASSNKITEKDRWDIILTLSIRSAAGLPDFHFDQSLVIALLDFPQIDISKFRTATAITPPATVESTSNDSAPRSTPTNETTPVVTKPGYAPFHLNTQSPSAPTRLSPRARPSHDSMISNDAFVGDTTQIRWHDPESNRRLPHSTALVLQHKCPACADGRLLTKAELQKHEVEHAHSAECARIGCARRFCKEMRNRTSNGVGC